MRKEASFISVGTLVTVLVLAVSGGMFMGALASDVETLEEAQKIVQEDHDRLITVEAEVKHLTKTQDEMRIDVAKILTAVNTLNDRGT